jgi:predicted helicase
MAKIFHAHLRGDRETKYDRLTHSDINKTAWSEILPQTPFHLLVPQDTTFLAEYEQGLRITDVMPVNSTGIKTHRDHFVIDFDRSELYDRISKFRSLNIEDGEIARLYNLEDTQSWNLSLRRHSLASAKHWEGAFVKCLYRPFDLREYYHHPDVVERPRDEVVKHLLLGENVALMWTRPLSPNYDFSVMAGNNIPHQCVIGNKTAGAGASYFAPLYIYPDTTNSQSSIQKEVCSNFSHKFICEITAKLGYTPTPEAIFYYIYAIFHSPTYRSRYAEFLKIDFPRVPLTRDDTLFRQLATYGEQLVALHLMKSDTLKTHQSPQFIQQGGNNIVDPAHPKYEINTRSVIINKKGDRFTDIPQPVWNFYVGGYPVCAKWLKDRKGRTLSPADIAHYQQIVIALGETIKLMAAIDQAIPGFPIE